MGIQNARHEGRGELVPAAGLNSATQRSVRRARRARVGRVRSPSPAKGNVLRFPVVRFVWHSENVEHVARHGLTPEEVEEVFGVRDLGLMASGRRGRWLAEGTVSGRLVAFTRSGPEEVHVITAYPIGRRRRKT